MADRPSGLDVSGTSGSSGDPGTPEPRPASGLSHLWWIVGLAIAAVVVVLLAPLASPDPDGLERVAEDQGFLETAQDALYEILPDYTIPGITDPAITTILAGLIGVAVVFVVAAGLGRLLARRSADHRA